jgi:ribA/ribD-fused uncharacterized protein
MAQAATPAEYDFVPPTVVRRRGDEPAAVLRSRKRHAALVHRFWTAASKAVTLLARFVFYKQAAPRNNPFSNMSLTAFEDRRDGSYHSVEQAYQLSKLRAHGAPAHLIQRVAREDNPFSCKRLAKAVPSEWSEGPLWKASGVAREVMLRWIRSKFRQNNDALKALLNTGAAYLCEATHDVYWAVGFDFALSDQKLKSWTEPGQFPGLNWQGLILMQVREIALREWVRKAPLPAPLTNAPPDEAESSKNLEPPPLPSLARSNLKRPLLDANEKEMSPSKRPCPANRASYKVVPERPDSPLEVVFENISPKTVAPPAARSIKVEPRAPLIGYYVPGTPLKASATTPLPATPPPRALFWYRVAQVDKGYQE